MGCSICQSLRDILAEADGREVFGTTGDVINPLLEAVRSDDRFRCIGVRRSPRPTRRRPTRSSRETIGACAYQAIIESPAQIPRKEASGFGMSKVREGLMGLKGDHDVWKQWRDEFRANVIL